MRTIAVDATAMRLLATGPAQPVPVWAELADGTRKIVPDRQDKDADGVPLWTVELLAPPATERDRAEIIAVRVASHDEPRVREFEPVQVQGLTVACSVNRRTGALSQYWSAKGVQAAHGTKPQAVA